MHLKIESSRPSVRWSEEHNFESYKIIEETHLELQDNSREGKENSPAQINELKS